MKGHGVGVSVGVFVGVTVGVFVGVAVGVLVGVSVGVFVGVLVGFGVAVVQMRPIWLPLLSVNQRAPSGPAVMLYGPAAAVGIVNSVMTPPVVIRPILLPLLS